MKTSNRPLKVKVIIASIVISYLYNCDILWFPGDLTTNAILTSTKKDAKTNCGAKFAAKHSANDII